MSTEKQIEANRLNSLHSCGPKSPESKAKVSQESHRPMACAEHSASSPAKGRKNSTPWSQRSSRPNDLRMTPNANSSSRWLSIPGAPLALRMEDACFDVEDEVNRTFTVNSPSVEIASRYHTRHDRAYQRAAKELMERRKQRQLAGTNILDQLA